MKRIKLKVNHINKDKGNYLVQYLSSLGIDEKKISSFLYQPQEEDQDDYSTLDNISLAAIEAHRKLEAGAQVFVQVDSDTDGYTSAAVLINYLRRRYPQNKVHWRLHKGKEHGVIVDTVPEECDLVFIPDAGTNQVEEHKQLAAQNRLVIVLDHHECIEDISVSPAIIVNNQVSRDFSNKYLSGVGIVYLFIQAMDKLVWSERLPIYKDYLDLTAIGIIADMMNMTTLGNNYISYFGLSSVKNKFIQELAERQARGIKDPKHLTKIDVAFYIAPVINGVIRSGNPEDKEIVFRALTEEENNEVFVTEWRGATRHESLFQYAARLAANAKSRQDSAKKRAFEWICQEIRDKGLDKHNIIIVSLDEKQSTKVSPNLTGLIAMELVKEFNKPCLVLRETEFEGQVMYGGSGRNGNFYGLTNLLDFLHDSQLTYYAAGHQGAFGCFVEPHNIEALVRYADENINTATFNDLVYEVDYWFYNNETVDTNMLMEFAKHNNLWGNSIPQPKFAIDADIRASQVMLMGQNKDSVRIKIDGVDCVIFKDADLAARLSNFDECHVTIVGRAQLNEWGGHTSVQLIIDDIDIQEIIKTKTANLFDLI